MKNREYKTVLAIVLAITMAAGTMLSAPSTTYAKETTVKTENAAPKDSTGTVKPFKDETVYAKIDGSGTVTSLIVSDQLKNMTAEKQINDVSTLENIENVKGDETFSQKKDSLVWNSNHEEICYQGSIDKTLPVGVKITYTLDGKVMDAKALEGKSGHLIIHYQYENTSAKEGGTYTPFLMITGLVLDTNTFANVKVTNGKLLSDGDRDMALGMGLPEVKATLGVQDLDIPDFFEVEADVTNYEAAEGITVADNEVFNSLQSNKLEDLKDLKTSMNKLQDSANQLVDGSGELKKGLDTLLDSSGTLTSGIQQLADGSGTLKNGTSALFDGSNTLSTGLSTAADKTANVLLPGAKQLDDGVTLMQKQLSDGMTELAGGIQQLDAGLNTALPGNEASLRDGAVLIDQVVNQGTSATGGASLTVIAASTAGGAQKISDTMSNLSTSVTAVSGAASSASSAVDDALTALNNLPDTEKAALADTINALTGSQNVLSQATPALVQAAGSVDGLAQAASAVAVGGASSSQIINQLGAVTPSISNGISAAADGAAQLNAKVTTPESGFIAQVNSGVSTLKNGTTALLSGIEGENGLASGLNQLSAGATQLHAGVGELDNGAGALASGIQTLQTGSGALIDGVRQLDNGAATLNNGMIQFNQEGIQKLVNAFDGDVNGLLDKLNSMMDASKQYKNFSGISDKMDGEVKFVFVTNK